MRVGERRKAQHKGSSFPLSPTRQRAKKKFKMEEGPPGLKDDSSSGRKVSQSGWQAGNLPPGNKKNLAEKAALEGRLGIA